MPYWYTILENISIINIYYLPSLVVLSTAIIIMQNIPHVVNLYNT